MKVLDELYDDEGKGRRSPPNPLLVEILRELNHDEDDPTRTKNWPLLDLLSGKTPNK